MRHASVLVMLAAGCRQKVYSPPSQLFAVTPIAALPDNTQSLDINVSRHAQIFDPPVDAASGRLRHGIGKNSEVSVEGSTAAVRDDGPSRADRTFYTGRVGVRSNPERGPFTFSAGGGGGVSGAAGSFIAGDIGMAVGWNNCVLVPSFEVSGFVSQPTEQREVDVTDDPSDPEVDTPTTTYGGVMRFGLRLSLSPSACRHGEPSPWLGAGVGFTKMIDRDSDTAIPHIGLGIEIPLTE